MPDPLAVLLIEHRPDISLLVQRTLARVESGSMRVECVDSVQKGLVSLAGSAYDAILLDLELPESAGLVSFNQVREHRGKGALIVLTSAQNEELALGALGEGADEYLIQGEFDERGLPRRVRYAVERARSRSRESGLAHGRAKILGFVGVKGGAGTTTVVLNLAAAHIYRFQLTTKKIGIQIAHSGVIDRKSVV